VAVVGDILLGEGRRASPSRPSDGGCVNMKT
jgi:hypothetical protein